MTGARVAGDGGGQSGSDIFVNEEQVDGLLKSLISAQGLNSAWQRIAKRMQAVEQGLKQAQEVLRRFPEEYVRRADLMNTGHQSSLSEHSARLSQLDELTSRLSDVMFQDHQPKLQDCLTRIRATEQAGVSILRKVTDMQERTEAFQTRVLGDLARTGDEAVQKWVANEEALEQIRSSLEERCETLNAEIQGTETRLQALKNRRTQSTHTAFTTVKNDSGDPSEQQAMMLDFVSRHLVEPVAHKVEAGRVEHEKLDRDVAAMREDFAQEVRAAHKTAVDATLRMEQVAAGLKADLEPCAKRAELQRLEGVLSTNINGVTSNMESLQTRVTLKLNELVDHLGTLHETMDDHEHCLRHHAEEMENRSTKYELLTCQHQIDRCALKDDLSREVAEVRETLSWQTSRIEGFGLSGRGFPKRKQRALRRQGGRTRLPTGSSGNWTPTTQRSTRSQRSSGESTPASPARGMGSTGSRMSLEIPADYFIQGSAENEPLAPLGELDTSRVDDHIEDGEDDESSEESEDPPSCTLRRQLEGVAMGLVGLGHLVLRETKLGTSRNAKLIQEKELLQELVNLRQWISSRMAPAGWDPSRLTTVALRCSHPREDELQTPLPRICLKQLVASLPDEVRSARSLRQTSGRVERRPSVDPNITARFSKLPSSARTAVGPSLLPPLQGRQVGARVA